MTKYFTLANKHEALSNLHGQKPKFVLRQEGLTVSINDLITKIVNELKFRNFNVPGVDLEFSLNSRNEIGIFRIFGMDGDVEIVSDHKVRVKGFELNLFDDGSGSLEVYCGDDWNKDKQEFIHQVRHHRKMNNMSRIVLQYDKCYNNPNLFKATDDIGRGYYPSPERGEPIEITLFKAENEINIGLIRFLESIEQSGPKQQLDKDIFSEPFPTFLTNSLFNGTILHTTIDNYTAQAYKSGEANFTVNPALRLLSFSIRPDKSHKFHKIMNDGFIYCKIEYPGQSAPESDKRAWRSEQDAIVTLNKADNCFVIDDLIEEFKKDWFTKNPNVDRMTDEAYLEMMIKRANSIVPINEYDGTYKNPLVIINRTLTKEEIKLKEVNETI